MTTSKPLVLITLEISLRDFATADTSVPEEISFRDELRNTKSYACGVFGGMVLLRSWRSVVTVVLGHR